MQQQIHFSKEKNIAVPKCSNFTFFMLNDRESIEFEKNI